MLTPEEQNALKVRHLYMQAQALANGISQLWYNYNQLFDAVDLTDEAMYDKCVDMVMELDSNLSDMLKQIRERASTMEGYFEPVPDVSGIDSDFEADVLTDLANLDELTKPVYNKGIGIDLGWDDPENPHKIEELPTDMSMGQFLDVMRNRYYNGEFG